MLSVRGFHFCFVHLHTPTTATASIDGDLVFQFVSWVGRMRSLGKKMMVLGAPFEADAQLVKLQKQSLIDCILTQDGDTMLLGATLIQFGKSFLAGISHRRMHTDHIPSTPFHTIRV